MVDYAGFKFQLCHFPNVCATLGITMPHCQHGGGEPNETRYVECSRVCAVCTFSHIISSVSFLHFSSFVTVMYILPSWYWPHLLFPPGLAPVFVSVIRAYKILQLGLWWNMGMILGAEFYKLHSKFHLGRGCILFIPTTSWAWNIAGTE